MSRVSSILLSIKKSLNFAGVTLPDILKNYERQSNGIISSTQLSRTLSSYGVNLNAFEIRDLETEFKLNNGISISALIAAAEMSNFPNESSHENCFDDLLALTQKLSVQNTTIVDCLKPFERVNNGYVSYQDFLRALGGTPECQRIAKSFMNPKTNLINIREVQQALTVAQKSSKPPQAREMPKFVSSLISILIRRGVDLRQIFQSYDKVSCGKIPTETFAMSITSIGKVQLLPQEVKEITEYYYDSNGMVNYLRFVNDMDRFRDQAKLRQQEQAEIQQQAIRQTAASQVNLQAVMTNLKKIVLERRIIVSDCFPNNQSGPISRYVFLRILNQCNWGLSPQEITVIADYYSSPDQPNLVDYQKFIDFFKVEKVQKPYTDINQLLQNIARFVVARQANIQTAIQRFDRGGSAIMPSFQFLCALQKIGINLQPNDVNELVRVFPGNYQNSISLPSFFDALNPLIRKEESEKLASQSKPQTNPIQSREEPNDQNMVLPKNVQEIIRKVILVTLRNDIHLYDEFHALDRTCHTTISSKAFYDFMVSLKAGLTNDDLNTLYQFYQKNSEFDYIAFCRYIAQCIQNRNQQSGSGIIPSNSDLSPSTIPELQESTELTAVLTRIRALEIKKMLDISDLFAPFDHTKVGMVPCKVVASVFANNGLMLKNHEYDLLLENYKDSLQTDMFRYRPMAAAVSSIRIPKDQIDKILYPEYYQSEMVRELVGTRTEIREKLHVRRRNAYMLYSNVTTQTIDQNQFFDRLSDAGIILMKLQRESILKYYGIPGTTEVDFHKFCDDVETSNIISK